MSGTLKNELGGLKALMLKWLEDTMPSCDKVPIVAPPLSSFPRADWKVQK
jgi:hypothetical protein